MERVDFYILSEAGRRAAELFACRLAEKAYMQGHRIFIHTEDRSQAEALDELLWTFRQGSFLPHGLAGEDDDASIVVGERLPERASDLLINLGGALTGSWQAFERLAEIIDQRPESVQPGRERFRQYRELGYSPQSHRIDGETA